MDRTMQESFCNDTHSTEDSIDSFLEELETLDASAIFEREERERRSSNFSVTTFDWEEFQCESQDELREQKYSTHIYEDGSSNNRVSFGNVQIREHPMVVGDNPGGMKGVPVTIAWEHVSEVNTTLERYENVRSDSRRNFRALQMTSSHRESMLLRLGFSRSEMNRGMKAANIARSKRKQTRETMSLSKAHERLESLSRKVKKVFSSSKSKRAEKELMNAATTF